MVAFVTEKFTVQGSTYTITTPFLLSSAISGTCLSHDMLRFCLCSIGYVL